MTARRPSRAAVAAVIALAALFQLPFYDRWVSFLDEGHVLAYADLLAQGGELYRDATLYPLPGAFYLLAAVFRLAGTSILVAREVVLVEFALLTALVFCLLRRLVPAGLAAVGVLLLFVYRVWAFPHWQMYSYSSTALLLLAGALLALVRFFEDERPGLLIAAGLLGGLAVVCKQDYGVAGLIALHVALAVHTQTAPQRPATARLLLLLDGPPLAVAAVTALHFWRQGLLVEMLRQTVWGHLVGIATFRYPTLPSLSPLFRQDPVLRGTYGHMVYVPSILYTVDWEGARASWLYRETAIWDTALKCFFYAPYGLVVAGTLRAWRERGRLLAPERRVPALVEVTLVAFAAAALAVFSLGKPRDYVHLAVLYWPFLALALVLGHALLAGRGWRAAAAVVLLVAATAPFLRYTAQLAWRIRTEHPAPLTGPRGGIAVKPGEAQVLADTVAYVQDRAGPAEPVAVLPYFPLVSFLAARHAPHRSAYVAWPVPDHPERDRQLVAAMEATETRVVVYSLTQWPQFPRFEEYARPVFDYLVDRFEIDRVFSPDPWGYVLLGLRRRTAPVAGVPVPLERGEVRVESPGEVPRPVTDADRAAFMTVTRWPFRPVVALRPLAGGRRTVLSLPLHVPAGARLQTAVAVNPANWIGFPALAVRFTIAAGADVLFDATLDPQRDVADRRWVEVDVPLARYAGEDVRLDLAVTCQRPEAETLEMAGFAPPRLVRDGAVTAPEGGAGRGGEEAAAAPVPR